MKSLKYILLLLAALFAVLSCEAPRYFEVRIGDNKNVGIILREHGEKLTGDAATSHGRYTLFHVVARNIEIIIWNYDGKMFTWDIDYGPGISVIVVTEKGNKEPPENDIPSSKGGKNLASAKIDTGSVTAGNRIRILINWNKN